MSKATIVIPNINGKGWLKDSIESIYAQTEQDFDLIVVDNGSTDESLAQARSYCTRPNFTLIENGRNTGCSTTTPLPSRSGWPSFCAPPMPTRRSLRCKV